MEIRCLPLRQKITCLLLSRTFLQLRFSQNWIWPSQRTVKAKNKNPRPLLKLSPHAATFLFIPPVGLATLFLHPGRVSNYLARLCATFLRLPLMWMFPWCLLLIWSLTDNSPNSPSLSATPIPSGHHSSCCLVTQGYYSEGTSWTWKHWLHFQFFLRK